MIIVIASNRIKAGHRDEFIKAFKPFAETVRKENGCIEYFPAVDAETGLPPQEKDPNVVTIIEKWQSLEALQAHMKTAEMRAFGEKSREMIEQMSIRVLQEA